MKFLLLTVNNLYVKLRSKSLFVWLGLYTISNRPGENGLGKTGEGIPPMVHILIWVCTDISDCWELATAVLFNVNIYTNDMAIKGEPSFRTLENEWTCTDKDLCTVGIYTTLLILHMDMLTCMCVYMHIHVHMCVNDGGYTWASFSGCPFSGGWFPCSQSPCSSFPTLPFWPRVLSLVCSVIFLHLCLSKLLFSSLDIGFRDRSHRT